MKVVNEHVVQYELEIIQQQMIIYKNHVHENLVIVHIQVAETEQIVVVGVVVVDMSKVEMYVIYQLILVGILEVMEAVVLIQAGQVMEVVVLVHIGQVMEVVMQIVIDELNIEHVMEQVELNTEHVMEQVELKQELLLVNELMV